VTEWRSAVIDEKDSLHVERHKLAIVHFIEPTHRERNTAQKQPKSQVKKDTAKNRLKKSSKTAKITG